MASAPHVSGRRRQLAESLRPHWRRIAVGSWLLSSIAHLGLLLGLALISQSRGCAPGRGGGVGGPGGISLYMGADDAGGGGNGGTDDADAFPAGDPAASADAFTARPTPSESLVDSVLSAPPVGLNLPSAANTSATAGPQSGLASNTLDRALQPWGRSDGAGRGSRGSGSGTGGGSGAGRGRGRGDGSGAGRGGGSGGTSLFGAADNGRKFVYVIDRSWSMEGKSTTAVPLSEAKSELIASLQQLEQTQQFQVIFYNSDQVFALENDTGRFDFFWGTDSQRLDAARQMASVQPAGGTDHMPALRKALDLKPDVVFFLTDGQEPPLTARDLDVIRRSNGGARIHCIEFGEGPPLIDPSGTDAGNWLRKLARDNGGSYVYRDIRGFGLPAPVETIPTSTH